MANVRERFEGLGLPQQIGVGAGIAVAVGLLLWFMLGRGGSAASVNNPDGFKFVCGNGHEFTLSDADLKEYKTKHLGEPIKCPKCGDTAVKPVSAKQRIAPSGVPTDPVAVPRP